MKTLKDLQRQLCDFTDEELNKELNRRHKKRLGKVLGYRAILYGDEYNYGGYSDYLIGETRDLLHGGCRDMNKQQAKELAERCVEDSDNGGSIEIIYKHNLKYSGGRIH
jgi:hypothetical protein